jgi:hypothetical protein
MNHNIKKHKTPYRSSHEQKSRKYQGPISTNTHILNNEKIISPFEHE